MLEIPKHEELTDTLFRKFAHYVYEHARIRLNDNKRELVRARIGKVIRSRGFKGYRDYYQYMIQDETGDAVREVLNAISTNLTSFFREPKHFEYMQKSFIPWLVERAEKLNRKRVRVWSAGCSSGEEAYTLALVLLEGIQAHASWDIRILATDIDTNMLDRAGAGIYAEERVKTVSRMLLQKYFDREEETDQKTKAKSYRVIEEMRKKIAFRYLNLMEPWPFSGKFGCIFCRNVMIYFDKEMQAELVNRFFDVLDPGGHLFIGHSEGLSGIQHQFEYVQPTIYRKPEA